MSTWKVRLRAASLHFVVSLAIAAIAAALVFVLWYPYPYREISGGRELFLIVVAVDVVLGPLITFSIFNPAKPWKELGRDLVLVGLIQLAGLGYGLWTVYVARPVHLVFEIDRFRIVHAIDVPEDLLDKVPAGIDPQPLTGPTLVAVRPFASNKESIDATMIALQGIQLAFRPDLWQPYEKARTEVLQAAKPMMTLKTRFPTRVVEIDAAVASTGRPPEALVWLPMVGRKYFWTVVLDGSTAQPLGYLPIDSF